MAHSPPEATPRGLRQPFGSIVSLLSSHRPPSPVPPKQLVGLDRAIKSMFDWSTTLAATDSHPSIQSTDAFCAFLRTGLFDFRVKSASSFSPESTSNPNATQPHGPRPLSLEGHKASAILFAVRELLRGLNERARTDGDWWYRIGVALCEGLTSHLDVNPVGKKTLQDLAYRGFICQTIAQSLVDLFVPNPSDLPKSSAEDLGGLGRNMAEMSAKYSALDALGDLLSKNEKNKSFVKNLFPPRSLGLILHAAWDHHLSHATFELAFRLLPAKRSSEARRDFLAELFPEDVFGEGKEKVAQSLREMLDQLDISSGWDEGYQSILRKISELHIRRSQYFKALSLEYDSNQLLGARDRAAPSAAREPSPSLRSIADESYYEARLLWVSRHILAATVLRVKDDGEETEERMAVSLDGVRRLFVEELAAEGCLRVTFLIDAAHPLTLASEPYASAPAHVSLNLRPLTETQAGEYAAAQSALPKFHRLTVIIKRTNEVTQILRETLLNRGKQYPRLLDEIADFPQTSRAGPEPDPTRIDPRDATQREDGERRVTFAATPDPDRRGRHQKASEPQEVGESTFPTTKGKGGKEKTPMRSTSQEETEKRRNEIATLAGELEENAGGREAKLVEKEKNAEPHKTRSKPSPVHVESAAATTTKSLPRQSNPETNRREEEAQSSELSEPGSDAAVRLGGNSKSRGGSNQSGQDVRDGKVVDAGSKPRDLPSPPRQKRVTSSYARQKKRPSVSDEPDNDVEEARSGPAKNNSGIQDRRSGQPLAALSDPPAKKVASSRRKSLGNRSVPRVVKRKGVRSASPENEGIGEGSSSEAEEGAASSGESDLVPVDQLGRVTPAKRARQPSEKLTTQPSSKRGRTSRPSGNDQDDEGNETDYDSYPAGKQNKTGHVTRKKYGKDKKSPAKKVVGKTKKAGKSKIVRPTKQKKRERNDQSDRGEEEEEGEGEAVPVKARRQGLASIRNAPVIVAGEVSEIEETPTKNETTNDMEQQVSVVQGAASVARNPGRAEERVPSRKSPSRSERAKGATGKAKQESTPPPFDAPKSRGAPSVSETTSNQPRKNFSELIQAPASDSNRNRQVVGANEENEENEGNDLGGFDDDFYHVDEAEESREHASQEIRLRAEKPQVAVPSLSPVPHPATTDSSFADRAFGQVAARNGADRSAGPKVLVDDTPEATPEQMQQVERSPVFLGHHRISSQQETFDTLHHDVETDSGVAIVGAERSGFEFESATVEDELVAEGVGQSHIGAYEADTRRSVVNGASPPNRAALDDPSDKFYQESVRVKPRQPRQELVNRPIVGSSRPQHLRGLDLPEPRHSDAELPRFARPAHPVLSRPIAPPHPAPAHYRESKSQLLESLRRSEPRRPAQKPAQESARVPLPPRPVRTTRQGAPTVSSNPHRHGQPSDLPHVRQSTSATSRRQSEAPVSAWIAPPHATSQHRGAASRPTRPGAVEFGEYESLSEVEADDDLDESDEELFASLVDFADIVTRKNRQRRLERQKQHADAQARFEKPLVDFLEDSLTETYAMIEEAESSSLTKGVDPRLPEAQSPAQRLIAAATRAADVSDRLWNDLQQQLQNYGPTPDIATAGAVGGGVAGGGVADDS